MNYLLFVIIFFGALAFVKVVQDRHQRLPPRAISASPPRWRDMSRPMRAFKIFVAASGLAMTALMLTDFYIETEAVRQPTIVEAQYRYPEPIKGRIRYLTERQERIYSVVHPLMFWFWVPFLVLGSVYTALVRQQSEKARRLKLERLLDEYQPGEPS